MIPTVAQVLEHAAQLLGDPDQDVFTDDILMNPFETAFRDLYRVMRKFNLPRINRTAYYNLPAYTTSLAPVTANISDFGQPTRIWGRGGLTTTTISAATNATPIVLTIASATGFANNNRCTVDGVSGPTGRINEDWFITVSGSSVTLVGSIAAGVWSSGGNLTKSSEEFVKIRQLQRTADDEVPGSTLGTWEWRDAVMRFSGASQQRQLKIEYESSGAAPITGTVGVDDSEDYLAYRTSALSGLTRGMQSRGHELNQIALGEKEQADGRSGMLADLINPDVQQKSRIPKQPMRFRRRRQHHLGYGAR